MPITFALKLKSKKHRVTVDDLAVTSKHLEKQLGQHHGVYLKLHNNQINKNTLIYRYIEIDRLIEMISQNKLYAQNIQRFEDAREINGINDSSEHLSAQMLWPIPDYESLNRIKRKRRTLHLCASCWTFDLRSNGAPSQSFLMWKANSISYNSIKKIYEPSIRCRIETSIGNLIDSIESKRHDIVISDVVYGERTLNDYEQLLFHKSIYYDQEQEIRLAVLTNKTMVDPTDEQPIGMNIKINVKKLLTPHAQEPNKIIVSPFAKKNDERITVLERLCKSFNNVEVIPSSVFLNNRYYSELYNSNITDRTIRYNERVN